MMSLTVTFLGTGGSVPTPDRGLPAVLIQRDGEHFLFDCGEGVQRQMIVGKTGFHKKMKVFITHMHGDHVLGLPGLLQTMSLLDRTIKLDIYGPNGIEAFVEAIKQTVQFASTFPVNTYEIKSPSQVLEDEDYEVHTVQANHAIPAYAYALIEKPRL